MNCWNLFKIYKQNLFINLDGIPKWANPSIQQLITYNQGQRDAFLHIRNVLSNIGIDIGCLIDERSDEMHQTHLDEQVMAKENEL